MTRFKISTSSLKSKAKMFNEIIADYEVELPLWYQLSRLLSLSVYIRPEVIRAVRLKFLKIADISTEMDLWDSPLVNVRAYDGIRFHDGVDFVLRHKLLEHNAQIYDAVYFFIKEHFQGFISPLSQIEEELFWAHLSHHPKAKYRKKELLTLIDHLPTKADCWKERVISRIF